VALTSSVPLPVFGQTVTFTATVSVTAPGAGTPTGTVTFLDGGSTLGTGTLSGGTAPFTTSTLPVGSHPITAAHSPRPPLPPPPTARRADTSTALASSGDPPVSGQSVTFTAAVSVAAPGLGTPDGTVTFTIDGVSQGDVTLSGGQASFSTSALGMGDHTVTAT